MNHIGYGIGACGLAIASAGLLLSVTGSGWDTGTWIRCVVGCLMGLAAMGTVNR